MDTNGSALLFVLTKVQGKEGVSLVMVYTEYWKKNSRGPGEQVAEGILGEGTP